MNPLDPATTHISQLDAIRAMGRRLRAAPSAALVDELLLLTHAPDAKAARYAVLALGGVDGHTGVERRLLELWDGETLDPAMRRAVVKSLGTAGGKDASLRLATVTGAMTADPELERLRRQALLILARRASRVAVSDVGSEQAIPLRNSIPAGVRDDLAVGRLRVRLNCRNGLEALTRNAFLRRGRDARVVGAGRVELWHDGPLAELLAVRTFESFAITLPPEPVRDGNIGAAAAAALTGEQARRVLQSLTIGAIRYRLAWEGEGRQNQLVWNIAHQASTQWPQLVNDPSGSVWEARLHPRQDRLYVDLVPKALADTRFAYREASIPAASHPPLAAALASVAQVGASDVIWDPFVGSASELIECAKLSERCALVGSDIDQPALTAAARNIAAAGLTSRIRLLTGDALALDPLSALAVRPTLIISNPPLGRRVAHSEAARLLDRFLERAAALLAPGGRLVWISPSGDQHAALAGRLALRLSYEQRVDMGGFSATIQRFER